MRLEERVNTYGRYLKQKYGRRVFRAGISYGYECDHRIKNGGCIFCLPETFTDENCAKAHQPDDNEGIRQLELLIPKIKKGIGLKETEEGAFLAYFQSGIPECLDNQKLHDLFTKTLQHPEVKGLIISTRSDSLDSQRLAMLKNLPGDIYLELGMQSSHQKSLDFLNRDQTTSETDQILSVCKNYNIWVGVHLIIGIPGESDADISATIDYVNSQEQIKEVKLHNLVVYQGTPLSRYPQKILDEIPGFEHYIDLLGLIIGRLRQDIVISRFFTSNIKGNNVALTPFSGIKREWLNRLTKHLNDKEIMQGMSYIWAKQGRK